MDCLQKNDSVNEYYLFECTRTSYQLFNSKWKIISTSTRLPGIIWQQFTLPRLLKKYQIEVLWAPEQICPVLLFSKIKVITTVHDLVYIRYPQTVHITNLIISRLLFKPTINRSTCLIPVSDFIHREIRTTFPQIADHKPIETITNGAPDWNLPSSYKNYDRKNNLFFAGNLEPRKNLESLLEAMALIAHKIPEMTLDIAGPSGWKNADIFKKLQCGNLYERVNILGYLSDEELQYRYANCKALVFPSFYEGFGMPVLEALKTDTLVLTSRGTVMEEILGDSALYFDPFDINDIAAKLEMVYKKDFNRNEYLRNKNAIINQYQWEKSAMKLKSLFESLVN